MTHEIKRDKRETQFKTLDELDYGGMRISITFRYIATFLTREGQLFGQGAREASEKHDNVLSEEAEAEALLLAFSTENRFSDFDWDKEYGRGFNVINFRSVNNKVECE